MITSELVKQLRDTTLAPMMECKKALEEANGDLERAKEILKKLGLIKAEKKIGNQTHSGLIYATVTPDLKKASLIDLRSQTDFVSDNSEFKDLAKKVSEIALLNEKIDFSNTDLMTVKTGNGDEVIGDQIKVAIAKFGENVEWKRGLNWQAGSDSFLEIYIHANNKLGVILELVGSADKPEIKSLAHDLAMHIAAMNPKYLNVEDISEKEMSDLKRIYTEQQAVLNKPQEVMEKIIQGRMEKEYQLLCLMKQNFIKDDTMTISDLIKSISKLSGQEISVRRFNRWEID